MSRGIRKDCFDIFPQSGKDGGIKLPGLTGTSIQSRIDSSLYTPVLEEEMVRLLMVILLAALAVSSAYSDVEEKAMDSRVRENVYAGELISYPGPWSFTLGKSSIILVSDKELDALSDPDKVLNLGLGHQPWNVSLRQICEGAKAAGQRTLILAFDHFFSQYRPGQEGPRSLTPDKDEYVKKIAAISKFVGEYGLKLELSLLSPLEIGPAYRAKTGECGKWLHYRKGQRDPETGQFSVHLWQQKRWANNKGVIELEDAGVRVFAFKHDGLWGTPYLKVKPEEIVEIKGAKVERYENIRTGVAQRIRVYGSGGPKGYDHVLVVQQYKTPEMDYFSDKALPYLTELMDKYVDAGVELSALYSDEMHIQQDWGYFDHHDNGEFALRYVSPGFEKKFAEKYGEQYRDLAKYMVYFVYGQEDNSPHVSAKIGVGHVWGESPKEVRETALFRSRYYKMLQDGVVDLFVKAKRHAEERYGYLLETRAHATWAESPTIDYWDRQRVNDNTLKYEYTSNFVWSNTVHQAAAACYDYFRWGDYLTGTGNDHCECGWLDRNYVGLTLACSTGILNEIPYSYSGHWGMPWELAHRRSALQTVYGASSVPEFAMVQGAQHRDVEVLMLYPMDLVAVEERFGSWMSQYGYANLVTQEKLLERGKVVDGAIEMAGRRFTTLVATFEPFPSKKLLNMMQYMAESGGRVIWSGVIPVLTAEGGDALTPWKEIFGVNYEPDVNEGRMAPGRIVQFESALAGVEPQVILTDMLVDRIYPVTPNEGTQVVARTQGQVIGTSRTLPGGGTATFLGYRPRDDQSASLGYETRNWFDVLSKLGAYPASGKFAGVNDNTEHISRTSEYLACRFPNGTISIAPHLKHVEEAWDSGFSRDKARDEEYLKKCPPPSMDIKLNDFKVNSHSVTYNGTWAMAFKMVGGEMAAFAGSGCKGITVDGKEYKFSDDVIWGLYFAPVAEERRVPGGAVMQILVRSKGKIRIPAAGLAKDVKLVAEGSIPGSRGETLACEVKDGWLAFEVGDAQVGRWLYVVGK